MTLTRTPACTVKGCPAPRDPDWHVPICGHGLEGHHHHVIKRSQGGKDGPQVFICPDCHHEIDNGLWGNSIDETYEDGKRVTMYRAWDLHNKTVIEQVIGIKEESDETVVDATDSGHDYDDSGTDTLGNRGGSRASVRLEEESDGDSGSRTIDTSVRAEAAILDEPPSLLGGDSAGAHGGIGTPLLTHEQRVAVAQEKESLVLTAAYNETSLSLQAGLSYEEWESEGHVLSQMTRCLAWWWGDWLNYGESNYGEAYSQAITLTGKDYSTVSHWKWVADKVEVWRRRQSLSWAHHREVAKLEPAEQEKWLNIADEERLTRKDFRERLRGDGDVLIIPKLYQCPDCGFTAKREGFREVSK